MTSETVLPGIVSDDPSIHPMIEYTSTVIRFQKHIKQKVCGNREPVKGVIVIVPKLELQGHKFFNHGIRISLITLSYS